MSAYTNHGKTTSTKRNCGRKSTFTERDCRPLRRTVSKNHRTTAAQVNCSKTEYSSWRLLPKKKLSDVCFTNTTSTVGLQTLNLRLLKVMPTFTDNGIMTIRQLEMRAWYGQMSHPSHCSLCQEEFMFGEHPRKPTIQNSWFQQWNRVRFCDGLGSNIMVPYSVGPIITPHGWITAREYVDWLSNEVHPMIQTFSKMVMPPFTQLELFSPGLKSMKMNFNIFMASTITRFEHHWATMVSYGD
jgi:hypothetical protein